MYNVLKVVFKIFICISLYFAFLSENYNYLFFKIVVIIYFLYPIFKSLISLIKNKKNEF